MKNAEYDKLLLEAMDAFPGTPEDFGEMLQTAVSLPIFKGCGYTEEFRRTKNAESHTARTTLLALPHGQAILAEERRRQS